MPPPVVTDATDATAAELSEAAALLFPDAPSLHFTRCSGGVNNKVSYVASSPSAPPHAVLRIYNNGNNTARVNYEHAVLTLLASCPLPFAIPRLLPPCAAPGATHCPLSSGARCCAMALIPGGPAGNGAARAIGAATARLVAAMAGLTVPQDVAPVNPLYRNFWSAHHTISPSTFAALVGGADFDGVRGDMDFLCGAIVRAEALIVHILGLTPPLPAQLINADLHTDNVLVDEGGRVTGVLDFEFAAVDWRVMELVVGVSKYCGAADPKPLLAEYVAGYGEGGGRLTAEEAALAPQLVQLRILNNVCVARVGVVHPPPPPLLSLSLKSHTCPRSFCSVYFAGRALAGEDSVEPLRGRADVYARRCKWLDEHNDWFVGLLQTLVAAP